MRNLIFIAVPIFLLYWLAVWFKRSVHDFRREIPRYDLYSKLFIFGYSCVFVFGALISMGGGLGLDDWFLFLYFLLAVLSSILTVGYGRLMFGFEMKISQAITAMVRIGFITIIISFILSLAWEKINCGNDGWCGFMSIAYVIPASIIILLILIILSLPVFFIKKRGYK